MGTSLEQEKVEQARWRLKPKVADFTVFDELMRAEFESPERQYENLCGRLSDTVAFAVAQVPYFQELFAERGLKPADISRPEDLVKLPVLAKIDLVQQGRRLHAREIPKGDKIFGVFASSGTTGRPAKVVQTHRSNLMFTLLGQRHARWKRMDPMGVASELRLPTQMPRGAEGRPLEVGQTLRLPGWRYLGNFFETGPYLGFSVFNPVEDQVDWLFREQPDYLTAYSETLEQLALATGERGKGQTFLREIRAISEQLTSAMHRRIVDVFGVPVSQNYGLNEIGMVAGTCEAGRYHVHSEHCLVEIVDAEGMQCKAGESGRILVTGFSNRAMPLLRYDTDDVAELLEGPCPCGRTLPSFGKIVGRYSRIAYLPEGTLGYVGALRQALEEMPTALAENLRQFQVHQFRDGRFEMRLRTVDALPPAFEERIRAAWSIATEGKDLSLSLVEVKEIKRPPSGKYQDFTSDYMPVIGAPEPEPDS